MVIEVAVTAPVSSAAPMAWTHLPMARSVAAAKVVCVYVVVPLTSTVLVVVALVVGLVALTTIVEPLTEVTLPDAPPNPPARPAPVRVGALPLPGGDAGVPDPPLAPPLNRPPPPPPNPPVQVPLVGAVMTTVVALIGVEGAVVDVVDDPGAPNAEASIAVTHEPTVTLAKAADSVWLNLVVDV